MTIRTYRNIAAVTFGLALLFGLEASGNGDSHGFASGLSAGMALAMLASAILFFWLARFVGQRLHLPLEYWRDLQRRHRATLFRAASIAAAAGAALTGVCWLASLPFVAGLITGPTGLLTLMVIGKLTGQIREI
jgi:hypothetical protein